MNFKAAYSKLAPALRTKREIGVRDTAAYIGISPATYSRAERGYVVDLETFAKLCKWLNKDPAYFLGLHK